MNLNILEQTIQSLQQGVTDLDKILLLFFSGWMGRLVKKDNTPYWWNILYTYKHKLSP